MLHAKHSQFDIAAFKTGSVTKLYFDSPFFITKYLYMYVILLVTFLLVVFTQINNNMSLVNKLYVACNNLTSLVIQSKVMFFYFSSCYLSNGRTVPLLPENL